jgi:hypothetical protein
LAPALRSFPGDYLIVHRILEDDVVLIMHGCARQP